MITLAQEQGNNRRTKEIDGSRKRQSRKACKRAMLRYAWLLAVSGSYEAIGGLLTSTGGAGDKIEVGKTYP